VFYEQGCGRCFFGFGEGVVVTLSTVADASGAEVDGVVGVVVVPDEVVGLGSGEGEAGVVDGLGDGELLGGGEDSGGAPLPALGGVLLQLADTDGVGFAVGFFPWS
jgi:hypothetical protein